MGRQVWEDAWAHAQAGDYDLIDARMRITHYNTFKRIHEATLARQWYPKNIPQSFFFLHGPTRTGKTYTAAMRYPKAFIKNDTKWWDGYWGEEVVIMHEMKTMSVNEQGSMAMFLKKLMDFEPLLVETKGGMIKIRPRCVIITSNYTLDQLFQVAQDFDPLWARYKEGAHHIQFTHKAATPADIIAPHIPWEHPGDGGPPETIFVEEPKRRRVVKVVDGIPVDEPPVPVAQQVAPQDDNASQDSRATVPMEEILDFSFRGPADLTRQNNFTGPRGSQLEKDIEFKDEDPFSQVVTQMVAAAEEISDSQAAIEEENDGDSEPSEGRFLGSQNTVNDDVGSYAGTNEDVSSSQEFRNQLDEDED